MKISRYSGNKLFSVMEYLVRDDTSIKKAMHNIDRSGQQVAFVIDRSGRLVGSLSDGDVRRAILRGVDIETSVTEIMNRQPVVLHQADLNDPSLMRRSVRRLLTVLPGCRIIPVVNAAGKPIQFLSCNNLKPLNKRTLPLSPVRNVLLVGGAGFLGSVLAEKLLMKNYRVRILDLLMYGRRCLKIIRQMKGFDLVQGDMRNIATVSAALSGMDAVINLAAVVGDAACSENPEDTIETNYLANKALAEACKYHQINRFIFASTCSVYGTGGTILDENSPLNPVSLYARSKIRSEEAILSLEDSNFAPVILRMATLYGLSTRMRFDLVVNRMSMTACRDRKIYVHGGGVQWRPLLNVEDAAEAYVKCLEVPLQSIKGQVFNVGSDRQNFQIKKIAEIIAKKFKQVDVVFVGEEQDQRNYSVSFDKVQTVLAFRAKCRLGKSILDIKRAIQTGQYDDLNNPVYYNGDYNK